MRTILLVGLLSASAAGGAANLFGKVAHRPTGRRYVDDTGKGSPPPPPKRLPPPAATTPAQQPSELAGGITRVSLRRCKLIPQEVLTNAVRESGLLGETPVAASAIVALSARLTQWYRSNGYLYASVPTRLPVEDGHLVLFGKEPNASKHPVQIEFFCPVDAPAAEPPPELSTMQRSLAEAALAAAALPREPPVMRARFRDRAAPSRIAAALGRARKAGVRPEALQRAEKRLVQARRSNGLPAMSQPELLAERKQIARCSGTTNGDAVARIVGLKPGQPWRFNQAGWQRLDRSGLFDLMEIARIEPDPSNAEELVVRLQVVEHGARKGKPARFRTLEPSVSISRGAVTGEVSLEDSNWRGANQKLSARLARANSTKVSARLHDPSAFVVRRARRDRGGPLVVERGGEGIVVSSDLGGFWRPKLEGSPETEPRAGASLLLSGVSKALGGAVLGGQLSCNIVPLAGEPPQPEPEPEPEQRSRWFRVNPPPPAPPVPVAVAPPLADDLPVLLEARITAGSLRSPEAVAESELLRGRGAPRRLSAGGELRLARGLPLAERCPDFWRLNWIATFSAPLLPPSPPPAVPTSAVALRRPKEAVRLVAAGGSGEVSAGAEKTPSTLR